MPNLKQKVAKGAVWALMERLSCQAVGFVVSMVLARLLTPTDYGTVALTTIFFSIAGVLVDGGFGWALVQKKDSDDLDFNSVFYLSLALSVMAYCILFAGAPLIARFYRAPELVKIVRVSALCFFFSAINSVQNAELTKKMLFHLSFRISLVSTVVSAVCGIVLALMGWGVWALVWSSLMSSLAGTIARWFFIAWRPQLVFSWQRLRPLFAFGWKMAASSLLNAAYNNLYGMLIGRWYSRADLAYVNKGRQHPMLLMDAINGTLERVAFPALAQLQNEPDRLREAMRKMISCSTFLVFPLMVGLAVCARPTMLLLFGEQWLPAVPYVQISCFSFALWPFHSLNLDAITALGRSDIFLKLEIIKKVIGLTVMFCSMPFGVLAFMAVSAFAFGPLGVLINAWPNRKLLGYTVGMQLRDALPSLLLSLGMGAFVLFIEIGAKASLQSCLPHYCYLGVLLAAQSLLGSAAYFFCAFWFKLEPMMECLRLVQERFGKMHKGMTT